MSKTTSPPASTEQTTDRADPAEFDRANLGCGDDYRAGWLNVDLGDRDVGMDGDAVEADLHHDLDETPWPFPDDCFSRVVMDNVIEHLDNQLDALRELARITRPGGIVEVSSPHWNSASMAIDPTHTQPLDPRTFDHYLVEDLFEIRGVELEKVRWATPLPDEAALWVADCVGHGVVEWTVEARVR